jgi:hypothetical protein
MEEKADSPDPALTRGGWDIDDDQTWAPGHVHIPGGITAGVAPVPAQISDLRWNGWAIPRFTDDNAMVVAQASVDQGDYRTWGWVDDVLVLVPDPAAFDGPVETFQPDPDGWYYLGSAAWTWEDLGPDLSPGANLTPGEDLNPGRDLVAGESSAANEPAAQGAEFAAGTGVPAPEADPATDAAASDLSREPAPVATDGPPMTIATGIPPRSARARRYDAVTTSATTASRSLQ